MKSLKYNSKYDNFKITYDKFEVEKNEATFIIIHGKHEFSNRYHEFAKFLKEKKINSYIINLRGHGNTGKLNNDFGYFQGNAKKSLIMDIKTLIDIAKKENPNKKIFLLGHSMGSYITRYYITKYQNIDGYFCLGTTDISWLITGFAEMLARIVSIFKSKKDAIFIKKLIKGKTSEKYKNMPEEAWLSHDIKKNAEYSKSHLAQFEFKNKTFADFLWFLRKINTKKIKKRIPNHIPIFLMCGKEDISNNNGKLVKSLYLQLKNMNKNIQFKEYKNMRHEILQEINRKIVFQDIVDLSKSIK